MTCDKCGAEVTGVSKRGVTPDAYVIALKTRIYGERASFLICFSCAERRALEQCHSKHAAAGQIQEMPTR